MAFVSMTPEDFCRVTGEMERRVKRMSFGCVPECREDFEFHAQALIDFLYTIAEMEFYKDELEEDFAVLDGDELPHYPKCPCDLKEVFDMEEEEFRIILEVLKR